MVARLIVPAPATNCKGRATSAMFASTATRKIAHADWLDYLYGLVTLDSPGPMNAEWQAAPAAGSR